MGVGTTPVPEVLSPRAVHRRGRDLGSVIGDIFEALRTQRALMKLTAALPQLPAAQQKAGLGAPDGHTRLHAASCLRRDGVERRVGASVGDHAGGLCRCAAVRGCGLAPLCHVPTSVPVDALHRCAVLDARQAGDRQRGGLLLGHAGLGVAEELRVPVATTNHQHTHDDDEDHHHHHHHHNNNNNNKQQHQQQQQRHQHHQSQQQQQQQQQQHQQQQPQHLTTERTYCSRRCGAAHWRARCGGGSALARSVPGRRPFWRMWRRESGTCRLRCTRR